MGNCFVGSQSDASKQNDIISKQLIQAENECNTVHKILFLGSGGSGKSTIFKQLRGIYGNGFNRQERRRFVTHIHEQVIRQMKFALEILKAYSHGDKDDILHQNAIKYIDRKTTQEVKSDDTIDYDSDYHEQDFHLTIPQLSESGKEAETFLLQCNSYKLNDEIVSAIQCLWQEPAIQKLYEMRNITKIDDSSAYFWDGLDQLIHPNYVPGTADILLVRYRTIGTPQETYVIPNDKGIDSKMTIIDVGGQQSERRKWIKCFDAVTAVIFVASLSCYDEVLYEDYSMNSMTDQLELFDEICNNKVLSKTSMILFLNKKDLFSEKIKRVPITKCLSFIDYNGRNDSFEETTTYIKTAFTSLNNMPKNIFTHITCATDESNIQIVFENVQHIVLEASLI
eukprot:68429_1